MISRLAPGVRVLCVCVLCVRVLCVVVVALCVGYQVGF